VTRVRSLASMHGRNADWAEDAVRHSVNISAEEAIRLHVADLEANDVPSLLATLDNRTVSRPSGTLTIHTAGAIVTDEPMPFWQVFLGALIDPTIAALLLLLAAYGIITELTSPGAILPGVVGGIAAVLAVVSLANLPLNIAGALMLIVALGLFVADLKANTHGILSAGGVVALVLGLAFRPGRARGESSADRFVRPDQLRFLRLLRAAHLDRASPAGGRRIRNAGWGFWRGQARPCTRGLRLRWRRALEGHNVGRTDPRGNAHQGRRPEGAAPGGRSSRNRYRGAEHDT